jgi:DNA-directed RNA polymerase subunit RPC12/RpoP
MIGIYDKPDAYICERCGRTLEESETELSYDDTIVCCSCGGEVVPAYRCEICEEIIPEDEIEGCDHHVCRTCLESKRYDIDFCTKVGESEGTECCLNSFLSDFFTESEINELMLTALKERAKVRPVDGWEFLKYKGPEAGDALFAETNA